MTAQVINFDEIRERVEAAEKPDAPGYSGGRHSLLLEALDVLALALAAHGHEWTDRERRLYESATAYLV